MQYAVVNIQQAIKEKFDKIPHHRRTRTVQSYSPGCANVHLHLMLASLGPLESTTTQTASRSVQPFLKGSRSWQTDHATPSITRGRIYYCDAAYKWRIRVRKYETRQRAVLGSLVFRPLACIASWHVSLTATETDQQHAMSAKWFEKECESCNLMPLICRLQGVRKVLHKFCIYFTFYTLSVCGWAAECSLYLNVDQHGPSSFQNVMG